MKESLLLLAVLFLAACGEQEPVKAAAPQPPKRDIERDNLLNMGHGASVLSRTAELTLENSALHAIDGDPLTAWSAPTNDPEQSITFSLPAPAKISRLGLMTKPAPTLQASRVTFAVSEDGQSFQDLPPFATEKNADAQFFDADLPRVQYVRVDINEGGKPFTVLHTVYANGEWLSEPAIAPVEGCWTANGFDARFTHASGLITGIIEDGGPTLFAGGRAGATYRLAWTRGPQWGEALLTMTPDGDHFSALKFHEEPHVTSVGSAWFGEREPCTPAAVDARAVANRWLAAAGWYPLFGLHFGEDGTVIEQESASALDLIADVLRHTASERIKLVAREFGTTSAQDNQRLAEARLRSLREVLSKRGADVTRIDFEAVGSKSRRQRADTEPYRLLFGTVELQIPQTARSAF